MYLHLLSMFSLRGAQSLSQLASFCCTIPAPFFSQLSGGGSIWYKDPPYLDGWIFGKFSTPPLFFRIRTFFRFPEIRFRPTPWWHRLRAVATSYNGVIFLYDLGISLFPSDDPVLKCKAIIFYKAFPSLILFPQ